MPLAEPAAVTPSPPGKAPRVQPAWEHTPPGLPGGPADNPRRGGGPGREAVAKRPTSQGQPPNVRLRLRKNPGCLPWPAGSAETKSPVATCGLRGAGGRSRQTGQPGLGPDAAPTSERAPTERPRRPLSGRGRGGRRVPETRGPGAATSVHSHRDAHTQENIHTDVRTLTRARTHTPGLFIFQDASFDPLSGTISLSGKSLRTQLKCQFYQEGCRGASGSVG